jgi:phosphoglycolate phosphatase-like HAD superfamily hydrolase
MEMGDKLLVTNFNGTLIKDWEEWQSIVELAERASRKEIFNHPIERVVYDPEHDIFKGYVTSDVGKEIFRVNQRIFLLLYENSERLGGQLARNLNFLRDLHSEGWQIHIVSYSPEWYVKRLLQRYSDLNWFGLWCELDDKLEMLKELKKRAKRIVYIDDQIKELLRARGYGMELVWICYFNVPHEFKGIARIRDFLELRNIL